MVTNICKQEKKDACQRATLKCALNFVKIYRYGLRESFFTLTE